MRTTRKAKTAEEFDRRFDAGEDIFDIATPAEMSREGLAIKRVNLDLPNGVIEGPSVTDPAAAPTEMDLKQKKSASASPS